MGLAKRMIDGAQTADREAALEVERLSQLLAASSAEHLAYLHGVQAGSLERGEAQV